MKTVIILVLVIAGVKALAMMHNNKQQPSGISETIPAWCATALQRGDLTDQVITDCLQQDIYK